MLKNDIDTLPFPPSLVFPDVDPDVLDNEGLHEMQAGAVEQLLGFIGRVLGNAMSSGDGLAQSAASA